MFVQFNLIILCVWAAFWLDKADIFWEIWTWTEVNRDVKSCSQPFWYNLLVQTLSSCYGIIMSFGIQAFRIQTILHSPFWKQVGFFMWIWILNIISFSYMSCVIGKKMGTRVVCSIDKTSLLRSLILNIYSWILFIVNSRRNRVIHGSVKSTHSR